MIFDGKGTPNVWHYVHGPLETGAEYNYFVTTLNFNGPSDPSSRLNEFVCAAPSGL